jgi:hypothetical protein
MQQINAAMMAQALNAIKNNPFNSAAQSARSSGSSTSKTYKKKDNSGKR